MSLVRSEQSPVGIKGVCKGAQNSTNFLENLRALFSQDARSQK